MHAESHVSSALRPRPASNANPAETSMAPGVLTRREFCGRTVGGVAAVLAGSALAQAMAEPSPADARPTRRWEVFIVQHSHIDIGFTDRQEVIADYHRQFVRQAVAMAEAPAQARRPSDCRFKYTIEGFWSLEQFLRGATAKEKRALIRALRSGTIELTAGYFHMTELLDETLLRSTLEPAQRFARSAGLKLSILMGCDINGFSWGYSDVVAELGVKFLSMNLNTHHGGAPLGGPLTPFYWETPKGRRLLVWNGLTYHRANVMGLMGYQAPDTDLAIPGLELKATHRYQEVHDISMAERKLLPTLAHLEKNGYPYDFLPLLGNAVYTDNGPAGDQYCDLIAEWNRKHGQQVHLRTATLAEFFAHLQASVREIPVHRGDWTDWWSDGVAATPLDTLIFRNAQRTRHLVRMLDPEAKVVTRGQVEQIDRRLALYAEHTFGYSDTPGTSLLTHQVFLRKTMHAVQADELAGQALVDVMRHRGEGELAATRPFNYRVINPLDRPVQCVVALPTDYWEHELVAKGVRAVAADGESLPCQIEPAPRGNLATLLVKLPARGEKSFKLERSPTTGSPASRPDGFENAFYRASWSQDRGWFSLVEKTSGRELLAPDAPSLGCPIYQLFPGGDRSGAAGFGYRARKIPQDQVSVGRCTGVKRLRGGEVFERWALEFEVPGTTRYVLQVTCYRDLPQIEVKAQVVKTEVTDPEGLYVTFPLAVNRGVWHLDKAGGPIRPGLDQLPGTCCDYYCVQAGAVLAGSDLGIAWTTLDAPLVHIGKLRLWNYATQIEPTGPIYSWLTNNKWETNFRLSCGGRFEFRYVLQAGREFTDAKAGIEACQASLYPPVVLRA